MKESGRVPFDGVRRGRKGVLETKRWSLGEKWCGGTRIVSH